MERVGGSYLIVAGPTADEGTFALYRWSGWDDEAPVPVAVDLRNLRPEAILEIPGTASVQLLSDDGGLRVDGVECKALPMPQQSFRTLTMPR